MDIFISKFLPIFIYPFSLAAILLLVGLLFWRKRSFSKACIVIAVLLIWVGGNRWVSTALARSLEWQYLPNTDLPKADVIVVLGGGTETGAYPRQFPEVNSAGDRMLYGIRLYQQGMAEHLLLSGGTITWMDEDSSTPASDMAVLMTSLGVPQDALWLEDKSQNTYENAVFAKTYLKEKNINRILLVTSAMHMPRSVKLFEAQGFEVIPAPVDYTITQERWDQVFKPDIREFLMDIFPSSSNMNLTTNVLKEYIGILVFDIRGR